MASGIQMSSRPKRPSRFLNRVDRYATWRRGWGSIHSLYAWVAKQRKAPSINQTDGLLAAENRRLQAEVRRLTEERDILKKAAAYFAKG